MKEIRTIVCPVDFSPGSEGATEYAISLAQKLGATVHLLHVYPLGTFVGPDGGLVITPQMITQLSEQSLAALRKLAAPTRAQSASRSAVRPSTRSASYQSFSPSPKAGASQADSSFAVFATSGSTVMR